MFRKIGEEKAFDAILNQIIDNIQDGNIKGGGCQKHLTRELVRRLQKQWPRLQRRRVLHVFKILLSLF